MSDPEADFVRIYDELERPKRVPNEDISVRYNQLILIIAANKPETIVEVGTWNGTRASEMAEEALKHREKVEYIGFDLFESATPETDSRELNVKAHHTLADVERRLSEFKRANPGFEFKLIKGDTMETLRDRNIEADLAFIDGGHSIETICNDYEALKSSKIIVFDDFYSDRNTKEHGCNSIVREMEDALVLPQRDPVKGGGMVQMVVTPSSAWPGTQPSDSLPGSLRLPRGFRKARRKIRRAVDRIHTGRKIG